MEKIDLCCPYCGEKFYVIPPVTYEKKNSPKQYLEPTELPAICLPYTRDVGKFDPTSDDDILSDRLWSRIGTDYLPFLNFERFGILRITKEKINVQYRAQKCVSCRNLFDVFLNYTENESLEDIWPHLLSRDKNSKRLLLYQGENFVIRFVRFLDKKLNSNFVGVFLFSLLIFVFGWFPYLLMNISDYRLSKFLKGALLNNISNPDPILSGLGLYEQNAILKLSTFFLYMFVSIGVMFLLIYFESYLSYLRTSPDFDGLFHLSGDQDGIGLIFWKNYISSRFVGVQRKEKFFPQPTQSDIFAGGISLVLALISWIYIQLPELKIELHGGNFALVTFLVAELLIWLTIIYFLSIAIFLSLSLTSYVLSGVKKIPMNITPYDKFSSSKSLRVLESYAVNIMLVVFIVILLVLSMLQMVVQIEWISYWFKLALALLFIAVGLGSSRNEYIVGAFLYLLSLFILGNLGVQKDIILGDLGVCKGVVYLIKDGGNFACPILDPITLMPFVNPVKLIPIFDLSVLALGFFLTGALAFQLYSADQYINNLLIKSKLSAILAQKKQLDLLQENLDTLNTKIARVRNSDKNLSDYHSQRYSVLTSIDTTIRIIDHLEKIEIKRNPFSNATKALTPLVATLAISIVQTAVMKFVFPGSQ
jgi:hypothetical protein